MGCKWPIICIRVILRTPDARTSVNQPIRLKVTLSREIDIFHNRKATYLDISFFFKCINIHTYSYSEHICTDTPQAIANYLIINHSFIHRLSNDIYVL